MGKRFDWIPFYEALADKLLTFHDSDGRAKLHEFIKEFMKEHGNSGEEKIDNPKYWQFTKHYIDPFSVIALITRSGEKMVKTNKRFAELLGNKLSIEVQSPSQIDDVPKANFDNFMFAARDKMWELFIEAMKSADIGSYTEEFRNVFTEAVKPKGNAVATISKGLYWIRPNFFMSLDEKSERYIKDTYKLKVPKGKESGEKYITFLEDLKKKIGAKTFPEIVSYAQEVERKSNSKGKGEKGQDQEEIKPSVADNNAEEIPKNLILYGMPGTGKTFSSILYAVAIIEGKTFDEIKDEIKEEEDYEKVYKRYRKLEKDKRIAFTTFHQSYGYEEFIEGIRPVLDKSKAGDKDTIKYELHNGVFKEFCNTAKDGAGKYVFIIDEFNRGNISKILGELITVIEPGKRLDEKEEIKAVLPYSKEEFGVPNNVYIIGTMNTADRSIARIDVALRRRFSFIEMLPDLGLLNNIEVDGIKIDEMLEKINERIVALLDREHMIGHSYFLPLKYDSSIKRLDTIFRQQIIPLLQEYFYDDYEKIRLVLGDNGKDEDKELCFIKKIDVDNNLFGDEKETIDLSEHYYYEINDDALSDSKAYESIYS